VSKKLRAAERKEAEARQRQAPESEATGFERWWRGYRETVDPYGGPEEIKDAARAAWLARGLHG